MNHLFTQAWLLAILILTGMPSLSVAQSLSTPQLITSPAEVYPMGIFACEAGPAIPETEIQWALTGGETMPGAGPRIHLRLDGRGGPYVLHCWRSSLNPPYRRSDTLRDTLPLLQVDTTIVGDTVLRGDEYHYYEAVYQDGIHYDWQVLPSYLGSIVAGQGTPRVKVLWHNPARAWRAALVLTVLTHGWELSWPLPVRLFPNEPPRWPAPELPPLIEAVVCDTPQGYQVALLDTLADRPERRWYLGDQLRLRTEAARCTLRLPPGEHTLGLAPDPAAQVALSLPALPQADFEVVNDHICQGQSIHVRNRSTPEGELTFRWDFDDATETRVFEPSHTYDRHGAGGFGYSVELTVENRYGCRDFMWDMAFVHENELNLMMHDRDYALGPDTLHTLELLPTTFTPGGSRYHWYRDNDWLDSGSSMRLAVAPFGTYWAWVEDTFGCRQVVFRQQLWPCDAYPAQIVGPAEAAAGDSFALHTTPVPGARYRWLRNGEALAHDQPELPQGDLPAGSYRYRLILDQAQPRLSTCADTSAVHLVEIR